MKKSIRVLLALLLAACMILAAGCGEKAATPAATEAPKATEAPADNGTETADNGTETAENTEPAATKTPLNFDSSVSTTTVDDYGWVSLACGYDYIMAVQKDGKLCGWGRNTYGQIGCGNYKDPNVMAIQPVFEGAVDVLCGEYHTAAIGSDGYMYIWGDNRSGKLGTGEVRGVQFPTQSKTLSELDDKIVNVALGSTCTFAIAEDGTMYGFGANDKQQLGFVSADKEAQETLPVDVLEGVAQAASGDDFSFAIKTDGTYWVTGNNKKGQLGTGDKESLETWTQLTTITDVKEFIPGEEFTLALKNDGTLWSVGSNKRGQLGTGSEEDKVFEWTKVAENVASAFAGAECAGYIDNEGNLYMFGMNKKGQLGVGDTENRTSPVLVMSDVIAADCGDAHGAAIKSNGSMWVWGSNQYYQLCDGTTTDSLVPKMVVTNAAAEASAEAPAETPAEETAA